MSTSVREWSVYFVLLCVASVPPVWTAAVYAEEPVEPEPVVQAEEVVVSATKTPVPVTQVTSAVEVITAIGNPHRLLVASQVSQRKG